MGSPRGSSEWLLLLDCAYHCLEDKTSSWTTPRTKDRHPADLGPLVEARFLADLSSALCTVCFRECEFLCVCGSTTALRALWIWGGHSSWNGEKGHRSQSPDSWGEYTSVSRGLSPENGAMLTIFRGKIKGSVIQPWDSLQLASPCFKTHMCSVFLSLPHLLTEGWRAGRII